jgi:hypothetical protein
VAIRRGTHTENFTVLPNELINDASMSLEARGLLILLLSKPAGWQISNAGLVAMLANGAHPVGRDLVGRMLREIVAAGYMVRSQEQLPDGTFGPTDYEVHSVRYGWAADQPLTAKPSTVQPLTVNPLQESNVLEPKKEQIRRKKREAPDLQPEDLPDAVASRKAATPKSALQEPTPEHRLLAKTAGVDCEAEWLKYRDWLAASGRRHRDLSAGFRNWLRRAEQFAPKVNGREAVNRAIWGDQSPLVRREKRLEDLLDDGRAIDGVAQRVA